MSLKHSKIWNENADDWRRKKQKKDQRKRKSKRKEDVQFFERE
jgi:prophage tail gpP-like protein